MRGRALTWRTFVLSALLSMVMYVIFDIERAQHGMILLNSDALLAAITDMENSMAIKTDDR